MLAGHQHFQNIRLKHQGKKVSKVRLVGTEEVAFIYVEQEARSSMVTLLKRRKHLPHTQLTLEKILSSTSVRLGSV